MPRFSDEEVLDLLVNKPKRENEVLEFLYITHYNTIKRMILSRGGRLTDVEDVFQEAIVVFYEKVKSGNFRLQSQIKTYLYSVSRNLWIDQFRKNKPIQSTDFTGTEFKDLTVSIEQDDSSTDRKKIFTFILEHIGEDCKKVLVGSIYQQKSMEDIALEMNYENEQVARNKKYRCLEKLKKFIRESADLNTLLKEWR